MKTINIAPTWLWTAQMFVRFVQDGCKPSVIKTFQEELNRLGIDVERSCKTFRNKKRSKAAKERARLLILTWAKTEDERAKAKEATWLKQNRK
jgi:hypothetical protein